MANSLNDVRNLLIHVLGLRADAIPSDANTPLLGHVAELDSMAVIHVLTALEEHFGLELDDDDINGSTFETLGSLTAFVDARRAS